ncbi:hypothetical protein, partial [Motilimonas pumila]
MIKQYKQLLTQYFSSKQGKTALAIGVVAIYLLHKIFADDIAFWWTKGIPDDYIKVGNAYVSEVATELKGIDLHYKTLTFKGVKPKNWHVKVTTEWYSSDAKCTTRSSWAKDPVYIPTRYNGTYYGIDLGERYIITVPQTTNWNINKCDDVIYELNLVFYDK